MCADRVHVSDGDTRLMFVNSELKTTRFRPSLDGYDETSTVTIVWRT